MRNKSRKNASKKMGRPKLAPKDLRRDTFSFRVKPDVYDAIVQGAQRAGHGVNEEARRRLEQSVQIEKASAGTLDLGDAMQFARYARVLKEATRAAGDNAARWITYADKVPLMIDLDDPNEIERVRDRIRVAVDDFLDEANRYLEKYGPPPPNKAVRTPYGVPPEVGRDLATQQAVHRWYARRRDEILKNLRAELEALERDDYFMRRASNKSEPGHNEAVQKLARLRALING